MDKLSRTKYKQENYDNGKPEQNDNTKLKLHTKIVIYNVLELDEVRSVMILKLKLTVYWTDTELKYFDLKPNGDMNTLTPSEIEQIWIPTLLFTDTKYSQFVDFKNNTAVVQIDINKSKIWANAEIKQMFFKERGVSSFPYSLFRYHC